MWIWFIYSGLQWILFISIEVEPCLFPHQCNKRATWTHQIVSVHVTTYIVTSHTSRGQGQVKLWPISAHTHHSVLPILINDWTQWAFNSMQIKMCAIWNGRDQRNTLDHEDKRVCRGTVSSLRCFHSFMCLSKYVWIVHNLLAISMTHDQHYRWSASLLLPILSLTQHHLLKY